MKELLEEFLSDLEEELQKLFEGNPELTPKEILGGISEKVLKGIPKKIA